MSDMITKNIFLGFNADIVDEPIIYQLTKDFQLIPNVVKASVSPDKQGYVVLSVTGQKEDMQRAMDYLLGLGLQVNLLTERVSWDEDNCTQCGACTAVCPSQALSIQRPEMTVSFDGEKCVVCQMCILACPVKAVHLDF